MEKPKQKLLAYVGVSLFSGILLGIGFMSLGSFNNQESVSTNILSVSPTQMTAAAMPSKVVSYSGVINKIGNDSFSVYSSRGDVYNITFNEKTTFSQIVGASTGPYSPATAASLKVNYYAFASGTSDSSPFVANSVIFKAFDSAPYPLILKATPTTPGTTPAPTTPGTTPAPTSSTTTSAPTN